MLFMKREQTNAILCFEGKNNTKMEDFMIAFHMRFANSYRYLAISSTLIAKFTKVR